MEKTKGLMTSGTIWKNILFFSIPLLLGNLFQLLYNTVDSIVVGQYVGKIALAAVGASTPLINLIVGFFIGLSTGAGVLISRRMGAKNFTEMSKTVHTFIAFAICVGIFLMVVGYFVSPYLLELMKTPQEVLSSAVLYLQIYFLGAIFIVLYNAGTGVLQAAGDSKKPLYFLGVSSICNIFLDLFFVLYLKLGVIGVAYGTLISQAIACLLVLKTLLFTDQPYRLYIKRIRIDMDTLGSIIRIGIPSGLQSMIVSFSNVIVQSYINNFGSAAVAGFSSANKFDNFLGLPVNSFSLAITTFGGQNLGAHQYDRVRKGVRTTLLMTLGVILVLGIITFVFANECIGIFSKDPEVIAAGSQMMRIMIPFYFALCFHQIYSGALRSAGITKVPMYTAVFSFVIVRQIYLFIMLNIKMDLSYLAWGYSITWLLASILTTAYYHKSHWIDNEELKNQDN